MSVNTGGEAGTRDPRRADSGGPGGTTAEELALVEGLRRGDEDAFLTLVRRYQALLKRVARMYVRTDAVADEVVQETWLGVFEGIERFEGRASLKTWVVRILMNRARSRGERESRMVPFSALAAEEAGRSDPAVPAERFQDAARNYPGHWSVPLPRWGDEPEKWVISLETLEYLRGAIEQLPSAQRTVVTLRDEQEWTAEEVCEALGITEANQRVLLHRGRSKLRKALEARYEARGARP
ncbi:MAG TPA: sigma-70 family RNA polymerase sigma factor [Patescibacteria group bacterium]|nr:sigma-70 family RNA polymerase sigma factor [Patescibacteria group bacterium]